MGSITGEERERASGVDERGSDAPSSLRGGVLPVTRRREGHAPCSHRGGLLSILQMRSIGRPASLSAPSPHRAPRGGSSEREHRWLGETEGQVCVRCVRGMLAGRPVIRAACLSDVGYPLRVVDTGREGG